MRTTIFVLMSLASAAVLAQSATDKSFGVSGASCDQVNWSDAALAKYPQIGKACQAVVERDGKYYIKFDGEVRKVAKKGEELTVEFKGGQTSVLTPPPDFSVKINDKPVPAKDLRPGDKLTFYVVQERLAAAQEDLDDLLFVIVPIPEAGVTPDAAAVAPSPPAASDGAAASADATATAATEAPAAAEATETAAAPAAEAPSLWLVLLLPLLLILFLVFLDRRKPAVAAH